MVSKSSRVTAFERPIIVLRGVSRPSGSLVAAGGAADSALAGGGASGFGSCAAEWVVEATHRKIARTTRRGWVQLSDLFLRCRVSVIKGILFVPSAETTLRWSSRHEGKRELRCSTGFVNVWPPKIWAAKPWEDLTLALSG